MSLSSAIIYKEMYWDEELRAVLMIFMFSFYFYLFIYFIITVLASIQNENLQNSECFFACNMIENIYLR